MKDQVLLNAIIENAIDGIITINQHGVIELINPSACKLFLYTPEEIIGQNISVLIPSTLKEKYSSWIRSFSRSSRTNRVRSANKELIGYKKDGSVFPFRLGISEIKLGDKRIFTGFVHDLSYQKEAENKLLLYTQHLEELVKARTISLDETIDALIDAKEEISTALEKEKKAGQLKSRLLSMASHEFRTPLSTIQLSTSLIQRYAENLEESKIENHVYKIKSAISNLKTILDDFLQLEKAESNKVTVSPSRFEIDVFIKEIIDELQVLAKKEQKIIGSHTGKAKLVKLDVNLLKNCIINLVANSIKYSGEETSIEINTSVTQNNIIITVKDNGIGIPDEDQEHLFEAFFRAHNTGSIPGTGLGLHIVARYVKLMGGTISCKSEVNEGTLFTIQFPRK
ncbi:PAS domain-containing sensor histidine kinase [Flavobacterium rakeshii]|uniref:PAS domain-containing sensor histidine kinase n=1 Tax=Flavobacterium rakeshii TaxID=1038845 RepID=UPI002E7B5039|nr:PAS domain-containing sensor histidine kinase [Flavobacterium rakeshii]MEE1898245.1 PAS domain-containing sensor histidine kinase [Flavobacterium rakeshii]